MAHYCCASWYDNEKTLQQINGLKKGRKKKTPHTQTQHTGADLCKPALAATPSSNTHGSSVSVAVPPSWDRLSGSTASKQQEGEAGARGHLGGGVAVGAERRQSKKC